MWTPRKTCVKDTKWAKSFLTHIFLRDSSTPRKRKIGIPILFIVNEGKCWLEKDQTPIPEDAFKICRFSPPVIVFESAIVGVQFNVDKVNVLQGSTKNEIWHEKCFCSWRKEVTFLQEIYQTIQRCYHSSFDLKADQDILSKNEGQNLWEWREIYTEEMHFIWGSALWKCTWLFHTNYFYKLMFTTTHNSHAYKN